MRDVSPEDFVPGLQVDSRAEAFALHVHPDGVELIEREFPVAAGLVHLAFEGVEGDLAHDRVDHILHLRSHHRLLLAPVLGLGQKRLEGEHLAKHACRFRQRQRSGGQQRPLVARKHLVHAVTQFVRQRHDIARLTQVVHENVRMHTRHRCGRERSGRLAGLHRRIDPVLVEKLPGDRGHIRGERAVSLQHDRLGLGPGNDTLGLFGQRRIAIPMRKPFHAQPLRLHGVVAVRQSRIGCAHG